MILIILFLIFLFLVYFELAEMSIVASDEARLEQLSVKKGGRYRVATNIRKRTDILFSTVLAGINLSTVLFTVLLKREMGFMWGFIFSTLFISVIGEIVVKSFAVDNPEAIAAVVAPPLIIFHWLLYPLIFIIKLLGDGVLMIFDFKGGEREKITKEEMRIATREARATGGIEPEQSNAMDAISKLSQTDVRDIMVPRLDVQAIDYEARRAENDEILKKADVSRFPVYIGDIDNIIGVLFKEDVIGRFDDWNIEDKLRPIKFISGDRPLDEVLPELLQDKIGCAIVIDEYGGTEGFVSTDDVLFSIFETNIGIEEGVFIVNGSMRPERLGINTEEDTLAGFIVKELEEIPKEGQKVRAGDIEITVLDADERRVKKILIKREKK
jgi:putative hemolysin